MSRSLSGATNLGLRLNATSVRASARARGASGHEELAESRERDQADEFSAADDRERARPHAREALERGSEGLVRVDAGEGAEHGVAHRRLASEVRERDEKVARREEP